MSVRRYRVDVAETAELEADAIYLWLQRASVAAADRWYRGLLSACASLTVFPYRCAAVPGDSSVRRLRYGRYSVLYRVVEPQGANDEPIVRVLHIHHASRS